MGNASALSKSTPSMESILVGLNPQPKLLTGVFAQTCASVLTSKFTVVPDVPNCVKSAT